MRASLRKLTFSSLALISLLAGCSGIRPASPTGPCLNEDEVKQTLPKLEAMIDRMERANAKDEGRPFVESAQNTLAEDRCEKRVILRRQYRAVFYMNRDGHVSAKMFKPKGVDLSPKACLDRAESDIAKLKLPFAVSLLERAKITHADVWLDGDIGPKQWLVCTKDRTLEYWSSLSVWLHELSHEVKKKQDCFYFSVKGTDECPMFSSDLPHRSLGAFSPFPPMESRNLEALKTIQGIYLTDIDQPLTSLLDELSAYTVTTRVDLSTGIKR